MTEKDGSSPRLIPIGSLLRRSWHRYNRQFDTLIWIPVLPSLAVALASYLGLFSGGLAGTLAIGVNIIGFVLSLLAALALTYAAQNDKQFGESYWYALGNLLPYFWVYVLSLALMSGGLFLLIIPAAVLAVWLAFTEYVFVVEGARGLSALLKSKEYVRGRFWPVVLRLLAALLIGMIVSLVADAIGRLGGPSGLIAANLLIGILLPPFLVIYMLEIYGDLRQLRPEVAGTEVRRSRGWFVGTAIWGVAAAALFILIVASGYLGRL
ncbi:hypothetical protein M1295_03150 [Patescibacteria group bacterium]|nr:hypothetical protein [Patescibacteria group bacterium]